MPRKPRQRDLDSAVARAAPAVCDEILTRLRKEQEGFMPLTDTDITRGFVRGHGVAWDRAIKLVEAFKRECS